MNGRQLHVSMKVLFVLQPWIQMIRIGCQLWVFTPAESQGTELQIERWQMSCYELRNTRITQRPDRFVWSASLWDVSHTSPFIKAGSFLNMLPIYIMTLYIRQRRRDGLWEVIAAVSHMLHFYFPGLHEQLFWCNSLSLLISNSFQFHTLAWPMFIPGFTCMKHQKDLSA